MEGFGSLFVIAGCYIVVYTFGKINKRRYNTVNRFRSAIKYRDWHKK